MTHPSEAELALYAGGDLNWLKQRLTDRHVNRCDLCQASVVAFSDLRPMASLFPAAATKTWKRLESEMTANIRLGLSAGECVGSRSLSARSFLGTGALRSRVFRNGWPRLSGRPVIWACAVLAGVAGVGFIVQHPPLGIFAPVAISGSVLEASDGGLQVHEGSQTLRILNPSGKDVSHSVGSRGELGARYMDPTGYVTISQVYGQ